MQAAVLDWTLSPKIKRSLWMKEMNGLLFCDHVHYRKQISTTAMMGNLSPHPTWPYMMTIPIVWYVWSFMIPEYRQPGNLSFIGSPWFTLQLTPSMQFFLLGRSPCHCDCYNVNWGPGGADGSIPSVFFPWIFYRWELYGVSANVYSAQIVFFW